MESYVKEISSLKKQLDKQGLEIEELRMRMKMQESEVFNVMQDLKQDEKDDLESLSAFKSKIKEYMDDEAWISDSQTTDY